MRTLAVLALLCSTAALAAAQPGCKLFKTFQPAVGSSRINVPTADNFAVLSASVIGPAAGTLSRAAGGAPATLPLAAAAFAGTGSAGEWVLTAPAPDTPIPTWALVLCPDPSAPAPPPPVAAQSGAAPAAAAAAAAAVSVQPRAAGVLPGTNPQPPAPAPAGRGVIGLVQDKKEARREYLMDNFKNSVAYFTDLSRANKDAMNGAITAAIDLVESRSAATRAAVTSIGKGLTDTAQGLRADSGELGSRVTSLRDAAGVAVGKKVAQLTDITTTLGTATGAATADAVSVVGTAAELVKRKIGGAFGTYATTEGMLKASADTMVARNVQRFTQLIDLITAGLEARKAGKGPVLVRGIEIQEAKLQAFANAVEVAAAAAQRLPTKSELALGGLQFGAGALASATQGMLSSAGNFRRQYAAAFPRVAQMAGAAGR